MEASVLDFSSPVKFSFEDLDRFARQLLILFVYVVVEQILDFRN